MFLFGSVTIANSIFLLYGFNSGGLTIVGNASSRAGLMSDLSIHCKYCDESTPWQTSPRKTAAPRWVFVSLFVLKCKNQKCKFFEKFYSSSKIEGSQAFEVNRIVVATRNNGIGHQALAKFCCVMNMPPPMNENSYRDHVAVVRSAAQAVCKQSMPNAVEEVKTFYEPQEDGNFDIGVSGDGTQRKRGYSSSYGVVTALSTITGKVVHVEVMSKNCKEFYSCYICR